MTYLLIERGYLMVLKPFQNKYFIGYITFYYWGHHRNLNLIREECNAPQAKYFYFKQRAKRIRK